MPGPQFEYQDNLVDDHDRVSKAIYGLEVGRLGLTDSDFLFPGNNVDCYMEYREDTRGIAEVTFKSKIFVVVGEDDAGSKQAGLHAVSYFKQMWELGGSYLNPAPTTATAR